MLNGLEDSCVLDTPELVDVFLRLHKDPFSSKNDRPSPPVPQWKLLYSTAEHERTRDEMWSVPPLFAVLC